MLDALTVELVELHSEKIFSQTITHPTPSETVLAAAQVLTYEVGSGEWADAVETMMYAIPQSHTGLSGIEHVTIADAFVNAHRTAIARLN